MTLQEYTIHNISKLFRILRDWGTRRIEAYEATPSKGGGGEKAAATRGQARIRKSKQPTNVTSRKTLYLFGTIQMP